MIEKKQIVKELDELIKKYEIDYEMLDHILQDKQIKTENAEVSDEMETKMKLRGKYFCRNITVGAKSMKRFYKVISADAGNIYSAECLIFDEHPHYEYDKKKAKERLLRNDGVLTFESFTVKGIMVKELLKCEEITREEYNKHAEKFFYEMINLDWKNNGAVN